jgi:hypothetical protein
MRTLAFLSMSVKPAPVYWLPWSVLKNFGGGSFISASFKQSTQKLSSRPLLSRQMMT